ncbi:MAG: Asp-tRNA(Asn)/Glu-tRNA(Gln) amidotransferase subunit GatC [Candidatus Pacebacteria bacterium]|nr:Asp-tRNA(Asn)/Glu-tRNA(Gln) amidotransferase subunit GatC [Candidatus Paceibacterota bacterium]
MNIDDIKKLADLSRLSVSEEELNSYQEGFTQILAYLDSIKKVDVQNEEAFFVTHNVVREDELPGGFSSGEVLVAAAPQREQDFIKVKKII